MSWTHLPLVQAVVDGRTVTGQVTGSFLLVDGRVLVRLVLTEATGPEVLSRSRWVPATAIREPERVLLRSELWEIPSANERDFVFRTVALTLSDVVKRCGVRVELGRQLPGVLELAAFVAVPLATGAEYMATWLPLRRRCHPRWAPWRAPRAIAARILDDAGRGTAGYQLGHLPRWADSRHFWSVFLWEGQEGGRLLHGFQFSLPESLGTALRSRFKLKDSAQHG